eukprot:920930-Rhodomonas_salina.2
MLGAGPFPPLGPVFLLLEHTSIYGGRADVSGGAVTRMVGLGGGGGGGKGTPGQLAILLRHPVLT